MSWLWVAIALLVAALGLRRRSAIPRGAPAPRVDDDAVRSILETGRLPSAHAGDADDDDEPLDMEEAARAEEEFFGESWDEPEELRP